MRKTQATIGVTLLASLCSPGAAAPLTKKEARLATEAKFPIAAARRLALRVRPGRITDEELEREKGGSGLRYSFDISSRGKTYEAGVDARSGAVLENAVEGKKPD
ncbi:PepSY domain-containing protein [Sphingomonas phyllosphaerae]|uniref:PepSY domain-containing protein n=1 Tax=Sphingomonas phyllosphaerae TaxID=257003 RepID=UPI002413C8BD|nr:PepSY domain-containing protein [Sphingomonas phyllosphaerae]